MINDLKIYSVSDRYIRFLREIQPKVYLSKEERRLHTRKYVGVVLHIGKYCYYVPMSSPKETDYQIAGTQKVIKKSIIPIIRMVSKNKEGIKELYGTLRLSHMIPVPESELELYDPEKDSDDNYKRLVQNQIIFIRKNKDKILQNANILYKQKKENDNSAQYVAATLDFQRMEEACEEFNSHMQRVDINR